MSAGDMLEGADGDRILDLIGVVLVLAVLGAIAVLVLGAMTTPAGEPPNEGPAIDWQVQRIDDTEVRITHAGGPVVPTDEIFVTVDGRARHLSWSGEIERDDTAIVRAERGQTLRVFWTGNPGKQVLQVEWIDQ